MTRRRRRSLTLVLAGLVVMLLVIALAPRHRSGCSTRALPAPTAQAAARWLSLALTEVPCPRSGRVAYALRDDTGEPVDVLDPIDDPAGGYLGVFHSPTGARTAAGYRIALDHSTDLIHWRRLGVLDPSGASMPALAAVPGGGFLLAYEKVRGHDNGIRVRFYTSRDALLAGSYARQVDLPLRLSRYSNGTPSFLSVDWRGGPMRSVITLAFHYETAAPGGKPGADREATGVLRGLRSWSAAPDASVDARLSALGFTGNHGDLRQFALLGRLWRVYEAQERFGDFGSWHVLLDQPGAQAGDQQLAPLRLLTRSGRFATSFGNPVVAVVRAPGGSGQALVATLFVFGAGEAARDAGELVYYERL